MRQSVFYNFFVFVTCIIGTNLALNAQMTIEGVDYYGNEWIDYGKQYARIDVEQDGYYKLSYNDLINAGFPIAGKQGSELELYYLGQPVPIRVSNIGLLTSSDYIEFYGKKNDGWIDQFLFDSPEHQLNPDYSMYTDNSRYFLTYGESTVNRYTDATSSLTNLPDLELFYMHTEQVLFTEKHFSPPAIDSRLLHFSSYRPLEGYGSSETNLFEYTIPAGQKYSGNAPKPTLTIRQGVYFDSRQTLVTVNGSAKLTRNTQQLTVDEYELDLLIGDIVNNVQVKIETSALPTQEQRAVLAKVELNYPRQFVATDSDVFEFPLTASDDERYFEIAGFNYSENTVVLDLQNGLYIKPSPSDTGVRFKLPAGESTQIIITNEVLTSASVSVQSYEDYSQLSGNYLMITSEVLDNGPESSAKQYKTYRESDQGGGYDVMIVHSEDLIDQFAYGVKGHSIGIRNFSRAIASNIEDLEFIFLFGKGLDYKNYRTDPTYHLPTWGTPGSDNLLFAPEGRIAPIQPLGRISARTPSDALAYLDKVIDYEDISEYGQSPEEIAWMKKFIHLSGGSTANEIPAIFNFLNSFKNTIENSQFGATVNTYQKTTQDNVETTLSSQIKEDMDDGAFMLTFFGHSSSGTFDFSIEEPGAYQNNGKLPIINSLGCNSGDMFGHSVGLSESFVTEPEVGAIAFLASAGKAELSAQASLGSDYYNNLGNDFYGSKIGHVVYDVMLNLDALIMSSTDLNVNYQTVTEQFNLHGDPALQLVSFEGPDYTPTLENISIEPEQLSSNLDSINFTFEVSNLGQWTEETLNYMIIHDYGEDIDTFYGATITPKYSKLVTKRIPINGSKVVGRNEFNVVIDQDDEINEFPSATAESNNSLIEIYGEGFVSFAFDGSARPIYPTEYAMLVDPDITLKASADNAFVDFANYTIQIDTTELFDSPLLEETTIYTSGGLVKWTPSVDYQSNVVYYWRIKNDDLEIQEWRSSSFVYYPEKALGWNQSHYYQLQDLDYIKLNLNESRDMDFSRIPIEHKVINQKRIFSDQIPTYTVNSTFMEANYGEDSGAYWDISSGIYAIVIDPITSIPWVLDSQDGYPGAECAYTPSHLRDRNAFPFGLNNANRRECFLKFVEDTVPDGHYVILFTIQSNTWSYDANQWDADEAIFGRSIFSVLESQGATEVRSLAQEEVPYIFAYQKGVGPVAEEIASTSDDSITLFADILGTATEGQITSTVVGPASEWQTLEWAPEVEESSDYSSVDIYGIDREGEKTLLVEGILEHSADLSNINADTFPQIELVYTVADSIDRSAAALDYWRVYYQPLAEAAINTQAAFEFNNEFLVKGEELTLSYAVENVSDIDMSEMLVNYTIVSADNETITWDVRYNSLDAQSQDVYDVSFDTKVLDQGSYEFQISMNPNYDQPEQYLFNNVGILKFEILDNDLNPLLDVTFDGIRIKDGDVVSPTPDIQVTLNDDNLFSLLDSPEYFQLTLTYPDGSLVPVDVYGSDIEFLPAISGNMKNEASLIYSPSLEPGIYSLSVQGRDAVGNLAGAYGYMVEFEVVTNKRIVSLSNYPNPFSNYTNFAFNATGDGLPSDFALLIFNELGEVVRSITSTDIGQLPTGYNRVYYTWDGTDGSGGDLPNGVYFYRLFFGDSTGFITDKDFSKGYGKLVMMK